VVLLEAWAAKLPVVATPVGENPLMVKNGINGYLAQSGRPSDLAKALTKALKNKNRKQLGENGCQLVKENYLWKDCARKTYQVYRQVVKNEVKKT